MITSGIYAQGSFGLTRINPVNGVRKGNVIKIWHVIIDGKAISHHITRKDARNALGWFKASRAAIAKAEGKS